MKGLIMSHYIKLMLDYIFECKNFRNEIVWWYSGAEVATKDFPKKHDIIFRYTKTNKFLFNIQRGQHTEAQLKRYNIIKEDGTRWANMKGKLRKLGDGVRFNDVWEIDFLSNNSHERLGYPTQKPKELLKRIISASSNERVNNESLHQTNARLYLW